MPSRNETPLPVRPSAAAEAEAVVREWLDTYICRPHGELGRTGAVCPFVAPALKAGTLVLRSRTGMAEAGSDDVRAVVRETARDFRARSWPHANPTMRTLLVVLPDLPAEGWPLLDSVQAELKAELAGQGLMLGQFHPDCLEPAARNPDFMVSRSPVPLLAIRNMAVHDVLFLHHRGDFFDEYRRRFGSRYERRAVADTLFRETYQNAVSWHAPSASDTPHHQTNGEPE